MDERVLFQIRCRLQERREELLQSTARRNRESRQLEIDEPYDTGDLAAVRSSKEFNFQLNSHNWQLLHLVDAALSRIKDGEFGTCANCGSEIRVSRLEVLPWTQFCLACQESFEKD